MNDRLSRLSALRPPVRSGQPAPAAFCPFMTAERLNQLVGGKCVDNHLGRHMIVRRRLPVPLDCDICSKALRLIAPEALGPVCDPGQWLFLDTETTGLSGGTGTYAFLVGIAWWESDGLAVEQYFMRDHSEEPSLLLGLAERLGERRVLVTFNGKCFDWPLLKTRYRMARFGTLPAPLVHLDFLYPARQLWRLRLSSVSLVEIERSVLGLDRRNDIPSETIPRRYFDFLRGGAPEPIAEIFHHNQMDLRGLARLALRITRMLEDPERADCGADELFGISRILQRRGDEYLAGIMYERALEGGLPRAAARVAQRELALMARRRRDFECSSVFWEKLLEGSSDGMKAYEQLAIYYEHHAKLPQEAALLSREALVRVQEGFRSGRMPFQKYRRWHASFQHRLKRLSTKT